MCGKCTVGRNFFGLLLSIFGLQGMRSFETAFKLLITDSNMSVGPWGLVGGGR